MLKTAMVLGLLLNSSMGFGAVNAKDLVASNSSKTPFQTLESFFKEASAPAEMSDFDLINTDSKMQCVYASSRSRLVPNCIARVRIELNGQPSAGPLFPGTPNSTMEALVSVHSCSSPVDQWIAEQAIKNQMPYTEVLVDATEMTIHVSKADFIEYSPMVTRFRKNGDSIAIQAVSGAEHTNTVYGYCWRN